MTKLLNKYTIELYKWGIHNDENDPKVKTKGIRDVRCF